MNRLEARLQRFADRFHASLSRELEHVDGDGHGPDRWARGGRAAGGKRTPMAEINVTPFVDVMLVLLIIFMVTAPLLTAGVPVDLPDSRANPLPSGTEDLTISIVADGTIYIDRERTVATGNCRPTGIGARRPPGGTARA